MNLTNQSPPDPRGFPATDWAVVKAAATDAPGASDARARICRLYWYPMYAFVRRTWPSKSPDDAADAVQSFFAKRLELRDFAKSRLAGVRFRTWLTRAATCFLLNEWKAEQRGKRDPRKLVWIDAAEAEERWRMEPHTWVDPERLFERDVAREVLERALARLEREHAARGRAESFRRMEQLLVPKGGFDTYAVLEQRWGLPRHKLKARVLRMRRRLGQLICLELGLLMPDATAASECALRWLYAALDVSDPEPEALLRPCRKERPDCMDTTHPR